MKIRVLVVEDSLTVRKHLIEILRADPELDVVGEAENGKRAIELCQTLRPHVVTLDMMLPIMSGLAATEYIMAHCPTPILIVSSSTNRGELFKTYEALAAGALDVLEKPHGMETHGGWDKHFVSTVKMLSRIRVITHPRGRLAPHGRLKPQPPPHHKYNYLAIGTSTGGPAAIVEILRALPAGFPLPILLVVHINEPFGTAFANWLDGQTSHRVAYAQDGEPLHPARVFMAPANQHMIVRDGRIHLNQNPERHSCRPSVDVLFESLAHDCGAQTIACLLTGMGRDGAAGLLNIRQAGGLTIAQDEASSAVYGMPREAMLLGAAERILPLEEIAPTISQLVGTQSAEHT